MEPSAAIAVVETDLRRLVQVVYLDSVGTQWINQKIDEDTIATLAERQKEEGKRRAPARVSENLLDYTHLYELRKILEKDWNAFTPALGKLREFVALMDKIEDFRNAPAHSRELLPHEKSLLEGIAGTIRTQVTSYVSTRSSDLRHYPIVESIRDSFGIQSSPLKPSPLETVDTGLVIQVGAVIEFEARGWDPQGRDLTWSFGPMVGSQQRVRAVGTQVKFAWTVSTENVGANFYLQLELRSSGPFHRYQDYDQRIVFKYEVEPPTPGGP